MDIMNYSAAWNRDETLAAINRRIHDGVPPEGLLDRARSYKDLLFRYGFQNALPKSGSRVMEFGCGVGWIMEAMLEEFPIEELVGLDISPIMAKRGRERYSPPNVKYVNYDGLHFPFSDCYFDTIYSCAAIQHIEKHVAFLLFKEIYRVLKVNGHAALHFLSVHHIPKCTIPYEQECLNHVNNVKEHWHHFYSYDELFVVFSDIIGVSDFDIRTGPNNDSFIVHFSKGTGNRYLHPRVPLMTFPERNKKTSLKDEIVSRGLDFIHGLLFKIRLNVSARKKPKT